MTPVALIAEPGRLPPRRGADPELFAAELDRRLAEARRAERLAAEPSPLPERLAAALREELEACEVAAAWMAGEFDLDLKLALAQRCGEKARHYRLLAGRLQALGADAARLDPLARGHSPLFRYLKSLETPCERIAAGLLAGGWLSRDRDSALAELCRAAGDLETATLLSEVMGAEDGEHHRVGRGLLVRLAVTPEDQERARRAVARTLQLSGDRREPGRGKAAEGRPTG